MLILVLTEQHHTLIVQYLVTVNYASPFVVHTASAVNASWNKAGLYVMNTAVSLIAPYLQMQVAGCV